MKHALLSLLLSLPLLLPSQIVDQIKSASDDNLSSSDSDWNSGSNVYNSGNDIYTIYDDDDYEGYSAPEANPGPARQRPIPLPAEEQKYLALHNQARYAFIEVTPQYGYQPQYGILNGNLRLGYNRISSDVRYLQLRERGLDFTALYSTVDWQVLRARFVSSHPFQAYLGVGFMYETYNKVFFPELSLKLNLNILQGKVSFPVEGRLARDFNSATMVRKEVSVQGNYLAWGNDHLLVSLVGGYLVQRYYAAVTVHAPQLGVRVLLF